MWAKSEPSESRAIQVSQGRSKWAKGDPRVSQEWAKWAKSVKSAEWVMWAMCETIISQVSHVSQVSQEWAKNDPR